MNELLLHNASEKLRREMKSPDINNPATFIQERVAEVLDFLCKQDDELARAILSSTKTFADCCAEIVSDTKQKRYIADEVAFLRAVKFYLPDAKLDYVMTIKTKKSERRVSLMDFLEV